MKVINKKGFTLVELLAIIVVLAIIALLAVQAVLPTLDKAKKQLFALEAERAIEAAQTYYLENSIVSGQGLPTENGDTKCVRIKKLVDDGYFETKNGTYSGFVSVSKKGGVEGSPKYEYTISMSNGAYYVDNVGADGKIDATQVSGGTKSEDFVLPAGVTKCDGDRQ